jgi:hypothetical protein
MEFITALPAALVACIGQVVKQAGVGAGSLSAMEVTVLSGLTPALSVIFLGQPVLHPCPE